MFPFIFIISQYSAANAVSQNTSYDYLLQRKFLKYSMTLQYLIKWLVIATKALSAVFIEEFCFQ